MQHNIKLLNTVMDHIEADPRHHDQSYWMSYDAEDCGTVACFAGWAVLLHHGVDHQSRYSLASRYNDEHLPDEAMLLLGLTVEDSAWMFGSQRTREELRTQVDAWTAEALPDIDIDNVVASIVAAEGVSA